MSCTTCAHTSTFPDEHPLHSEANANASGYFKDELIGKLLLGADPQGKPTPAKALGVMLEFVGLRVKMYALSKTLIRTPCRACV